MLLVDLWYFRNRVVKSEPDVPITEVQATFEAWKKAQKAPDLSTSALGTNQEPGTRNGVKTEPGNTNVVKAEPTCKLPTVLYWCDTACVLTHYVLANWPSEEKPRGHAEYERRQSASRSDNETVTTPLVQVKREQVSGLPGDSHVLVKPEPRGGLFSLFWDVCSGKVLTSGTLDTPVQVKADPDGGYIRNRAQLSAALLMLFTTNNTSSNRPS